MADDQIYMQRCLELAKKGYGYVAPNPMVGAVLVFNKRIIGEGWHKHYGQPHAEVNCFLSVSDQDTAFISQATLYVSLEPCAHYGKTPPCADLIIEKKVPRVVVGCIDSFAKVCGQGIKKMRDAGIEVILDGPWNKACTDLNRRFFTFHQKKRPYLILKWAETADGNIAPAKQTDSTQRLKISGTLTDKLVHQWRSQEAAIMIGKNTALVDNPSLTNRLWTGPSPVRIVLDKNLEIPASAAVMQPPVKTVIINQQKEGLEDHLQYGKIDFNGPVWPQILHYLQQENIQSVLIEGGKLLLQSCIDQGYWDECRIITNTALNAPGGLAAPLLQNARLISVKMLGQDKISYFAPQNG